MPTKTGSLWRFNPGDTMGMPRPLTREESRVVAEEGLYGQHRESAYARLCLSRAICPTLFHKVGLATGEWLQKRFTEPHEGGLWCWCCIPCSPPSLVETCGTSYTRCFVTCWGPCREGYG